jgi:anti-sigma factor RsiW
MNRIQFGEGGCERIRKYLDAYVSDELMVETNHEVLRHIEGCPACAAEVDARVRLRSRLKAAVNAQGVPPELQVRVREHIRSSQHSTWASFSWLGAGWPRWAGAAAAVLTVAGGLWIGVSPEKLPELSDRQGQSAYFSRVSANLAAILKVGLGDHIHCAIFRKYSKDPPAVEKMETELGPAYAGLLPVVRASVPEGFKVVLAHQCSYNGRRFVHLTLEKDGRLLSLVVARKQTGESLDGLAPTAAASGVRIYQSAAGRYQVAGFEAGNFFAYVVSELKNKENLEIAENVAPAVREFLVKTV